MARGTVKWFNPTLSNGTRLGPVTDERCGWPVDEGRKYIASVRLLPITCEGAYQPVGDGMLIQRRSWT